MVKITIELDDELFFEGERAIKEMIKELERNDNEEEENEDLHGWIGGWHRYMKEYPEPWSFDAEFGKEDLGYIFDKYEEE